MGRIIDKGGQYVLDMMPDPTKGIKGWSPPGSVISVAERDLVLDNYWGIKVRRYFPISDQDALDMIYESRRYGKIMFSVENVEKPDAVQIKWLPYEKALMNAADDYYIIESKFLNGKNPDDEPNGILMAAGEITVATVGKKDDDYVIIVSRATVILTDDPGGGGEPPGSGVIIPPF
jgi:hypothetical protein